MSTLAAVGQPSETSGDWRSVSLGELAKYINGRAFKPSEWSAEGVPIIRIQNLTKPHAEANRFAGALDERHQINDGDLLVSWSASLDAFMWNRGPAALNQHIFKVQENREIVDRRFLFYALKAAMAGIRAEVHGSTMQHITKPKFQATRVRIPEALEDQRRIADEIEKRLTGVAALEAAARSQLEAAEASSGAIIHKALEKAHEGTIDEVPLGDVLALTQYGSSKASNRSGEGIPMLRMGNIIDNRLDCTDLVHVELSPGQREKLVLAKGDIVITRTNGSPQLVGKSALFDQEGDFVFASYLIRLRADRARCYPEYLQAVLSSSIGRAYVDKVKHHVGQFNINSTDIKRMPFPLPALEEQKLVLETLADAAPTVERLITAAEAGATAADALEDAVLREVFVPEVPVDEEESDG